MIASAYNYRSGAFYWSGHRTGNARGSCTNARNQSYGEFTRGCRDAKAKLDPFDQERLGNTTYRQGWNSVTLPSRSRPDQCSVVGIKPDDADGGLRIRESATHGAKVVGVIPYDGRGVVSLDCPCNGDDEQCRVQYKGVTGWVSGQYLFPD